MMKNIFEEKMKIFEEDITKTSIEIANYISNFDVECFAAEILLTIQIYNNGCKFGSLTIETLADKSGDYCKKVLEKALEKLFTDVSNVDIDFERRTVHFYPLFEKSLPE